MLAGEGPAKPLPIREHGPGAGLPPPAFQASCQRGTLGVRPGPSRDGPRLTPKDDLKDLPQTPASLARINALNQMRRIRHMPGGQDGAAGLPTTLAGGPMLRIVNVKAWGSPVGAVL